MKIDQALIEKRIKEGWHWHATGSAFYLLPPTTEPSTAFDRGTPWTKFYQDHYVPSWIADDPCISFETDVPMFKKIKIPRKLLRKAGIGYGARVKITVERIL